MKKLVQLIVVLNLLVFTLLGCEENNIGFGNGITKLNVNISEIDRDRILTKADEYLMIEPIPITDFSCERSSGGLHDFYSEGDYWWPNPENTDGPYIRRDGLTNPNFFKEHREAMRGMSIQVAALTAAFKITGEDKYAKQAVKHLKLWFVNEQTKMNPHMEYAQAIQGRNTGRGIGLIDGIHLVEPARAATVLYKNDGISSDDYKAVQEWFAAFLNWMNTHEYGISERDWKNNHGTCWAFQAAEYARLTDNKEIMDFCRMRYKTVILPGQMAKDGSFPLELKRTKPYGYSLFNIDIMASLCHIISTPEENLWEYELPDGRSMKLGLEFIAPFIKDKSTWPLEPDVMYWDEWPVRHPSLLFAGSALGEQNYIDLWNSLKAEPSSQEGLRNFPIRQPVLWFD